MDALAVVTFTYLCIKISDKNDDVKLVTALEEGIIVAFEGIALPCHTVFCLILGSLRSEPSVNLFPI